MKNENIKRLVSQYLCNMRLLADDNKRYTIILNYNDMYNNLFLQICEGDNYSIINKKNNSFKLIINAECDYLEASEAINIIRNDFIQNHNIAIPEIGPMPVRIDDTNYYYINCHHLRNTRFDFLVTLKTDNCFENAYIAQERAKRKIMTNK